VKALIVTFSLLGSAVLWGWALLGEEPPRPVATELQGEFDLFGYRPGPDGEPNPLTEGRSLRFHFREDGTYLMQVLLEKSVEMARFSGTAVPEGDDVLILTPLSANATSSPRDPERFQLAWAYDEEGEYLSLTQVLPQGEGRQLLLRKRTAQ